MPAIHRHSIALFGDALVASNPIDRYGWNGRALHLVGLDMNHQAFKGQPEMVGRFMEAAAERDYQALAACFTEDAVVEDESHSHHGREAIRRWQEGTRAKWEYTVTATGGRPDADGGYLVSAHLSGNFPGGEADVEYRFTLRGDLIARLRID
jgi:ketosteroid isomerase-like protein